MASIVGSVCISHAPGMSSLVDSIDVDMRARINVAYKRLADHIDACRPDVIIAVLDDHFENHALNLMPSLAIGIAEEHSGPAEYFLRLLRMKKPVALGGSPEIAKALLQALIDDGFDLARMNRVEYGNNLMTPLEHLRPAFDIPIIPLFINVFSPPLISTARAYSFGQGIRRAVEAISSDARVLMLGTGGLSHWPPFWVEGEANDDPFFDRMERFQTIGRAAILDDPDLLTDLGAFEVKMASEAIAAGKPLVNAEWDREVLDALVRNDVDYLCSLKNRDIVRDAGSGGMEILNWIAVHGASEGFDAELVAYEAVADWMCGCGFLIYS